MLPLNGVIYSNHAITRHVFKIVLDEVQNVPMQDTAVTLQVHNECIPYNIYSLLWYTSLMHDTLFGPTR